MTRVGPPTSRVGSGTSCQPMDKAPPTGPSSSWDKVGSGTDDCPQLGPHLLWLSPHLRFPPLWGEGVGGRSSQGSSEEEAALRAPLLPPRPQPGSACPPRLPPCLWVPILIPRVGGVVYQRCSLGPGRTGARCPLVAATDTAGRWARKAARREPEERQRPLLGKSTPFQRLGWTRRDPVAPCSASPRPEPHHSPHGVAQVLIVVVEQLKGVDLGGSRGQAGAEGVGLQEGCRAHAAPRLPSPTAHASLNCPQSLPMGRRGSGWGHPSLGWGVGREATCFIWGTCDRSAMSLASRTDRTVAVGAHQRLWFEILDDGVLTDRQMVLVATEDQAVVH